MINGGEMRYTKKIYEDFNVEINLYKNNNFIVSKFRFGEDQVFEKDQIYYFAELLQSFVHNQLNTRVWYKIGRVDFKVIQEENQSKLYITTIIQKYLAEDMRKEYIFNKYEIRCILRILNEVLKRCTFYEFV